MAEELAPGVEQTMIDGWRGEADLMFNASRACIERADRVLGLGVTVLTGSVAVGVANDAVEVVLGVPVALGLLISYVMQVYADAVAMGMARKRIEQHLADRLGQEILIYERRVAAERHSHGVSFVTGIGVGLLFAGSVAAGLVIALQEDRWWVTAGYAVAAAAASLTTVISWSDMVKTPERAEAAVATWPNEVEPAAFPRRLYLRRLRGVTIG